MIRRWTFFALLLTIGPFPYTVLAIARLKFLWADPRSITLVFRRRVPTLRPVLGGSTRTRTLGLRPVLVCILRSISLFLGLLAVSFLVSMSRKLGRNPAVTPQV